MGRREPPRTRPARTPSRTACRESAWGHTSAHRLCRKREVGGGAGLVRAGAGGLLLRDVGAEGGDQRPQPVGERGAGRRHRHEQPHIRHPGGDQPRHRRHRRVGVDRAAARRAPAGSTPPPRCRPDRARGRPRRRASAAMDEPRSTRSAPHGIHPAPKRASRASTRSLSVPLIQIGTPSGDTGFGIMWIPSKESSSDWYVARVSRHSALAHLERVVEQPPPTAVVEPGRLVLLALPADADAEVEAPARQHVEGGRRLGQHRRPSQGGEQDGGAEPHPGGGAGDDGQGGHRLQPAAVGPGGLAAALDAAPLGLPVRVEVLAEDDVVGHDDPVDARLLGGQRPGPPGSPSRRARRRSSSRGPGTAVGAWRPLPPSLDRPGQAVYSVHSVDSLCSAARR